MMKISTDTGKLNQRITIQHKPASPTDEVGYRNDGWTDYYSCWAAVNITTGTESWKNGERLQESSVMFKIRDCKILENINTTEYRIVFRNKYYDILAIDDMLFAGSLLNIQTVERKPLIFTDGVVSLCSVSNIAALGDKPKYSLNLMRTEQFNYEEISNQENYTDMQSNVKIALKIRIPWSTDLSTQNVIMHNERRFKIETVKHDKESIPPSTVLSLSCLEANYDIKTI